MKLSRGGVLLSLISAVMLILGGMSAHADDNTAYEPQQDMNSMSSDSANGSGDVTQAVENKQVDNSDDDSDDQGEPDMASEEDED